MTNYSKPVAVVLIVLFVAGWYGVYSVGSAAVDAGNKHQWGSFVILSLATLIVLSVGIVVSVFLALPLIVELLFN